MVAKVFLLGFLSLTIGVVYRDNFGSFGTAVRGGMAITPL
jgi:hypothetical protein